MEVILMEIILIVAPFIAITCIGFQILKCTGIINIIGNKLIPSPYTRAFKLEKIHKPMKLEPFDIAGQGTINIKVNTGYALHSNCYEWGCIFKIHASTYEIEVENNMTDQILTIKKMSSREMIDNQESLEQITNETNNIYFNKFSEELSCIRDLRF